MAVQLSPKILKLCWGSIEVEKMNERGNVVAGQQEKYRDAKLWPGGSGNWDWNETGTAHFSGITSADVAQLCDKSGVQTIVLTRGQLAVLQVPQAIVEELRARGFEVIVEKSGRAKDIYNDLVDKGKAVAGLFHTTC